jgi:hypothetical protein
VRRHDLDWVSLAGGLVFLAIAAAYLLQVSLDVSIAAGWVLPIALIGLGVAGLAVSLTRTGRRGR